jgi:hypothetical protein
MACFTSKRRDRFTSDMPNHNELVGTWKLTQESSNLLQSQGKSDRTATRFTLQENGRCSFTGYPNIETSASIDTTNCTWLSKREHIFGDASTVIVEIQLNVGSEVRFVDYFVSPKHNSDRILWTYQGDPDLNSYIDFAAQL